MAEYRKRRSQPISRHPLFPAIVALWFAALLGLGSLALSPAALEAMVLAGHVDALIPAAAPPLGTTARLILALALGLSGGAVGWWLARRSAASASRPAPQVLRMADIDESLPWPGMAEQPAPALDPSSLAPEVAAVEPARDPQPELAPEPFETQEVLPALTAAERIAAAELENLSHVELVERLAIALQRRQERLGTAAEEGFAPGDQVLRFPDFADRQGARRMPRSPAAIRAPEQTDKALREALAALQRMSGSA